MPVDLKDLRAFVTEALAMATRRIPIDQDRTGAVLSAVGNGCSDLIGEVETLRRDNAALRTDNETQGKIIDALTTVGTKLERQIAAVETLCAGRYDEESLCIFDVRRALSGESNA